MSQTLQEIDGDWDYIIIGGGSAGCVLANRLSANPKHRVLLLEAGGEDNWIWFHIPVGYLFAIGNPRSDWMFETVAEAGLNGRSLAYPRGRVLGGSSAINAMITMRGQAADYDHWRQLGLPGWSWADVLPVFRRIEDHFLGESEYHSLGGPWRVEAPRVRWDILDRVREAAVEMGVPASPDFNTGDNEGVGYFHVNQKKGMRWSSARGFLKPVRRRRNLRVITGARVDHLALTGRRVREVVYSSDGSRFCARVSGEAILSAGAIGSIEILQRSGIGPAESLKSAGVEPVVDRPGVGRNLQDHLQQRMIFEVSGVKTLNETYHSALGKLGMGIEYALRRRGPLTMAPSQLGIFTRSNPRRDRANLQFHIQPLSLDKFGEPLHKMPAITASACNLQPTSRGHVKITGPDSRLKPEIAPNYLSTEEDRQVAAEAIQVTRRLMSRPALAVHQPHETVPGATIGGNPDELAQAAGDIGTTIFHPVGTARMGRVEDPQSVVDARLRVIGVTGLRVIDASIMPTITSGNTNTPTIMIAEKGAEMVLEDRSHS